MGAIPILDACLSCRVVCFGYFFSESSCVTQNLLDCFRLGVRIASDKLGALPIWANTKHCRIECQIFFLNS